MGATLTDAVRDSSKYTRQRMRQRSKVTQALELQDKLRERINSEKLTPAEFAALISAWDRLEERIRILRMKPLPGSLTHEKRTSTKRKPMLIAGTSAMLDALDALPAEPGANAPDAPAKPNDASNS